MVEEASHPTLVVVGPLPPPLHGVTISTELVLANQHLRSRFVVLHLDTSDHSAGREIGRWNVRNITLGLVHTARFARMIARHRPGVVYLPLSQGGGGFLRDALLIRVAARARWRVAVHLRGSEFRTHFFERQNRLLRWWITSTLRRVSAAAVMGESLREVFGTLVPAEMIAVVPNGTPEIVANVHGRDPRTVIFLSNLRRRKGVVEAVDAALLVLEKQPDARFLFAGEWEEDDLRLELTEKAERGNGRISFLPPVSTAEKAALLASSAVMVFPPVEPEGHPRVVLEAIAAGLPIVTTNRGAIAETVVDGESGFVLAHPDPQALADHILRLLEDDALRERMGQAARARHREHFTQARADERLADWLTAVARAA
jgi:glycosyltransferase involved in cell wall biosynthesis